MLCMASNDCDFYKCEYEMKNAVVSALSMQLQVIFMEMVLTEDW